MASQCKASAAPFWIYAMAGAGQAHNLIAWNVASRLRDLARSGPCRGHLLIENRPTQPVPRQVLECIDESGKKKGQSRSGFLVEAARTAMHAR
jgi:hypothetical protein